VLGKVHPLLSPSLQTLSPFLNLGADDKAGETEIHLVAMVCKRGDVVRGVKEGGVKGAPGVPLLKVGVDCGL